VVVAVVSSAVASSPPGCPASVPVQTARQAAPDSRPDGREYSTSRPVHVRGHGRWRHKTVRGVRPGRPTATAASYCRPSVPGFRFPIAAGSTRRRPG
jgi:hypothetical protein